METFHNRPHNFSEAVYTEGMYMYMLLGKIIYKGCEQGMNKEFVHVNYSGRKDCVSYFVWICNKTNYVELWRPAKSLNTPCVPVFAFLKLEILAINFLLRKIT